MDLSGRTEVELRFFFRSFFDEAQQQEGLHFSDDGGATFTQVYRFYHDEESQNRYYYSPNIDVDALAQKHGLAMTSNFVIRFIQIGTGDFSTSFDEDGFYIDDISIIVPENTICHFTI